MEEKKPVEETEEEKLARQRAEVEAQKAAKPQQVNVSAQGYGRTDNK